MNINIDSLEQVYGQDNIIRVDKFYYVKSEGYLLAMNGKIINQREFIIDKNYGEKPVSISEEELCGYKKINVEYDRNVIYDNYSLGFSNGFVLILTTKDYDKINQHDCDLIHKITVVDIDIDKSIVREYEGIIFTDLTENVGYNLLYRRYGKDNIAEMIGEEAKFIMNKMFDRLYLSEKEIYKLVLFRKNGKIVRTYGIELGELIIEMYGNIGVKDIDDNSNREFRKDNSGEYNKKINGTDIDVEDGKGLHVVHGYFSKGNPELIDAYYDGNEKRYKVIYEASMKTRMRTEGVQVEFDFGEDRARSRIEFECINDGECIYAKEVSDEDSEDDGWTVADDEFDEELSEI